MCKEGATPWASLKAQQSATAAAATASTSSGGRAHEATSQQAHAAEERQGQRGTPRADAADMGGKPASRQAPAADWVLDKGIGRHRDSEKLHLDVYEDGQSADALDGVDSAGATDHSEHTTLTVPARTAPVVAHPRTDAISKQQHVGRHKTANKAGKSKPQAKKVVIF